MHAALEVVRTDGGGHVLLPILDDRRNSPAFDHLRKVARLTYIENDDRNIVVPAKRDRGGIHHLEVVAEHSAEANGVVALCIRDLLRVGGVDAVDAGALEQ